MKKTVIGAALVAAAAFATPATAQEAAPGAHPYVGVQVGYHDLGLDADDFAPLDIDDSALIYGAYLGVDFDVGTAMVIGGEANFNLGNGPIDSEYGAAARIGYRAANGTIIYVRGGYQWVNFDVQGLTGVANPPAGLDDTDGDFLVGIGADIAMGDSPARIRIGVDTVSFDTLRATAGVNFAF